MHLVPKQVKGHEYWYLVKTARRGKRVVTTRTVYIGNRKKLSELLQASTSAALPASYEGQEIGASLALTQVARDLEVEHLVDEACPVRDGAAPVGRQLLIAALQRALLPRRANGKRNLRAFYRRSALVELLPMNDAALDGRRVCETLSRLTAKQVEAIESKVVQRLIAQEGVVLDALAFDTTNFDSYVAAGTASKLLRRGHGKSGKPLRALGLGLLVTADDGIPLLTFTYPGNENDVTAFGRFLKALGRRRESLELPVDATVAADGGNISKALLKRLDAMPLQYVMRLPVGHVSSLARKASAELPALKGRLKDKVWAAKLTCEVYGVPRCVVDMYSQRMHRRQLPGLLRDRKKARADLARLQGLLERQRQGLRRAKPITVASLKRRVAVALAREHMDELFQAQVEKGDRAPVLRFTESEEAWQHLQEYVLGRTLLVTSRAKWTVQKIVLASRCQSHNERFFRDAKDSDGVSMLPLRHRRDPALRGNALVVVLALLLARVLQRRLRVAGVHVGGPADLLAVLRGVQRAKMELKPDAPNALRAFAATTWVPSKRSARQQAVLEALGLAKRPELGTTVPDMGIRARHGSASKKDP
jgi:transposase